MIPAQYVNYAAGAIAVIALSLAVMAFLETRRLRLEEERRMRAEDTAQANGLIDRIAREIEGSGVDLSARELLTVWITLVVVPALGAGVAGAGIPAMLMAGCAGAAVPPLALQLIKKRNRSRFQEQLGQTMPLIAANLRGGAALRQAIIPVAQNMGEPVRGEFASLVADMGRGMSVPDALDKMAARNRSEDLKLFASAVRAQEQGGGEIAEIVETVGKTIRTRVAIRNEVKSKTSQGRATAIIMAVVPPAMLVFLYMSNDMYREFYLSGTGFMTIAACAVMEALGYFICRKMCDIKTD